MPDPEIPSSPFSEGIGIGVSSAGGERAVAFLVIEERHCNAFGIAHGGVIFTLADHAFGVAQNCDSESRRLAMEMHVRFLRPVHIGQRLTATATRLHHGRQTAFYRVDVEDEAGRLVAAVTGTGHTMHPPR